jgi:hypothetical protein
MDIDISTQSLCEQVAAKVKSAKIETVLQTWTGIGLIVREQMLLGKGMKLDSFGTFSYTRTGFLIRLLISQFEFVYLLIEMYI